MSSSWLTDEKHWKALWKIKAPGKMIIHLWRFCHDCLPTGVQLYKRQIPVESACIFCERTEDIFHSMLTCQFARTVWREIKLGVPLKLQRKEFASTKQWIFDFLARANEKQATTMAVGFWHIWEARNESCNSNVKPNPIRTGGKSLAYMQLIDQHLSKTSVSHRCVPSSVQRTPPSPDTVLVNCDAAVFYGPQALGVGVIIQDHRGVFISAKRHRMEGLTSPEHAEALALKIAVQFARDEGLDKVIFQSDCLSLVQRMNSASVDRSTVGFTSVSFRHVKRSSNEAAHFLAQSCVTANSSFVFCSVPDGIRETLCNVII
jgi:hypothetical protein